jgi:enoyl-CoA hydratase/carnithine racemase
MFQLISLEKIGFVARITLTRPERTNAMNAAMLTEIAQAMDAIERDDDVRAVIVRGTGNAFLFRLRSQGANGSAADGHRSVASHFAKGF